jgi:lipopolysaccharide biosynthesis regulator YciM
MTVLLLVLACTAAGFAAGVFYAAPRRNIVERLVRRSRVLYELAEGDLENVAHELEQVAEGEPGDSTVFLALAALDRRRGRIERAKAIHRTVLASASLPPEQRVAALVGLGRDLLAQGNERAAVGALVRAISLAPRSVATLETLAKALEQAGAWERAAAAWERHEKLVEGRRRRESKIGRGHALAGQAGLALSEGDERKSRKLADRATELAPDSGHVWTTMARVAAAAGDPTRALEAWQRAWELTGAGAYIVVPEAWRWATEQGLLADLVERMLTTLRSSQSPELIVALAELVARQHSDQAAAALERVAQRSAAAQLALVRLRLARGQRDLARDAAMRDHEPPALLCDHCGMKMPRFRFRCDACGAWDSASIAGVGRGTSGPGRVRSYVEPDALAAIREAGR